MEEYNLYGMLNHGAKEIKVHHFPWCITVVRSDKPQLLLDHIQVQLVFVHDLGSDFPCSNRFVLHLPFEVVIICKLGNSCGIFFRS
jgi:hypothetical protein